MQMRVALYVPDRLFGFVEDESSGRVFFHASVFFPTGAEEPPPVIGEVVEVTLRSERKAALVRRTSCPTALWGSVRSFRVSNGWGFVTGDDAGDYFLHRSDILHLRIPVQGQRVRFYPGHRDGRARACYVEV